MAERLTGVDLSHLLDCPIGRLSVEATQTLQALLATRVAATQRQIAFAMRVAFPRKISTLEGVYSLTGSVGLLSARCNLAVEILNRIDESVTPLFSGDGGQRALVGVRRLVCGVSDRGERLDEITIMHWPEEARAALLRGLEIDQKASSHFFPSGTNLQETLLYANLTPLLGIVLQKVYRWQGSKGRQVGLSLVEVRMGTTQADRVADLVCRHFGI